MTVRLCVYQTDFPGHARASSNSASTGRKGLDVEASGRGLAVLDVRKEVWGTAFDEAGQVAISVKGYLTGRSTKGNKGIYSILHCDSNEAAG